MKYNDLFSTPKKNRIALVIDKSSSMQGVWTHVLEAVRSVTEKIKEKAAQTGQPTEITYVTFANGTYVTKDIGSTTHFPYGNTALFDGIGEAIKAIECDDPDTSFLVIVWTDGENNQNNKYSVDTVKSWITQKQKGPWSFAFQMPPGKSKIFARDFGIPIGNLSEWEGTAEGVEGVKTKTNVGTDTYFTIRTAGFEKTVGFYTDLSSVSPTDVKSALDDLSDRFRLISLDKEYVIKDAVETYTGKPYVIGSTYYQLMKKERVQAKKGVLLMEKGKKAVWGGADARGLLKLPSVAEARVTPGNHANYDIFIESRSVNRILPRGTKILIDVTKKKGEEPTWLPLS